MSMTKKTVCFYQVATHLGGAERSFLTLVKGLKESKGSSVTPWVLLPKKEGLLVDELKRLSIDYDVLEMPDSFFKMSRGAPLSATIRGLQSIPGMGMYLSQLSWLLKQRLPDLIHSSAIKCHLVSGVLSQAIEIPVLWHLRDILSNGPTLWGLRALRRLGNIHLLANSHATAKAFEPRIKEMDVVYNGLDPEEYFPKRNAVFHELLNIPKNAPLVGVVGVLARWKGQLEFIRMADRLIKNGSSAYFVIIGGEIYDTEGGKGFGQTLWEEAKKRKILDRVLFTGFRKNIPEAMNGLDVLVHASIRPEPFGRVVVEAMACGVPVVAARDGGVVEIIKDGKSGLLFKPGRVAEMAEAVERILQDQFLAKRLVQTGLEDFKTKFTEQQSVQGMLQVYGKLMSK